MTVTTQPATTETAPAADPLARERAFVEAVRALHGIDTGKLAVLRRASGGTLAEARDVAWFFGLLSRHGVHERDEETYFLAATLLAHDRRALEGRAAFTGNFGRTLARLRLQTGVSPEAVERRFRILLDARLEPDGGGELPFRLRQMVRLALSHETAVDWPQFLKDVRGWNYSSKSVQKDWARGFYDAAPAGDDNTNPVNALAAA